MPIWLQKVFPNDFQLCTCVEDEFHGVHFIWRKSEEDTKFVFLLTELTYFVGMPKLEHFYIWLSYQLPVVLSDFISPHFVMAYCLWKFYFTNYDSWPNLVFDIFVFLWFFISDFFMSGGFFTTSHCFRRQDFANAIPFLSENLTLHFFALTKFRHWLYFFRYMKLLFWRLCGPVPVSVNDFNATLFLFSDLMWRSFASLLPLLIPL